jgi:hypothetical protein
MQKREMMSHTQLQLLHGVHDLGHQSSGTLELATTAHDLGQACAGCRGSGVLGAQIVPEGCHGRLQQPRSDHRNQDDWGDDNNRLLSINTAKLRLT